MRTIPEAYAGNYRCRTDWSWLRSSDLKVQTEGLICAAQEQALRTNYVKHHIDRTAKSPLNVECAVKRVRVCVI